MRKQFMRKSIAAVLSLAMVVTGGGLGSVGIKPAQAADDTAEYLTKVLTAEDVSDVKFTTPEKASNVGEDKEIKLEGMDKTITIKDNGTIRADLNSQDLADQEMGLGINLGNTMEATTAVKNKKTASLEDIETGWGQPITTREYIKCLRSYGINTLRIPVGWSNGDMDDGTYTIRTDLMDRVEEIANYALDEGMYVIINDHWDNQWWGQFGACTYEKDENGDYIVDLKKKIVDQETRDQAWVRYEKYWTQIATRFKDYSDHLILEGANEELGGRLNDAIAINGPGKGYCKAGGDGKEIVTCSGNLTVSELYETVNKINQKFVDIVRSTGGNNEKRFLLIPGYNTNIQDTADLQDAQDKEGEYNRFKMPDDSKFNPEVKKLLLSDHFYTPWSFCGDGANGTYSLDDQKKVNKELDDFKKWSDMGYGIVIGECGVVNPGGARSSVTQWFYDTFKKAREYHAVPVIWETSNYFNRKVPQINYKDIAILFNAVTGANGSTDIDTNSGGSMEEGAQGDPYDKVTAYIDKKLWKTEGVHAFLSFQTSLYDCRDAYKPLNGVKNEYTWSYIKAGGVEVNAEDVEVTDALITKDGTYTVAISGAALTGDNYQMLSISTDVDLLTYPDVKITDVSVIVDDEPVQKDGKTLTGDAIAKEDSSYLNGMIINRYNNNDNGGVPGPEFLDELNEEMEMPMATRNMSITFTISGLDQIEKAIEEGLYVNTETGKTYSGKPLPTKEPVVTEAPVTEAPVSVSPTASAITATNAPSVAPTSTAVAANPATESAVATEKKVIKGKDGAKYMVTGDGKNATYMASGSKAASVTVADKVKLDGKTYKITAIGKNAFKNNKKLKKIVLGKNITRIEKGAFAGCIKLQQMTIKGTLKSVAKNSFKGCKKMIKVISPKAKKNIKQLKKSGYKRFQKK